MQPFPLHRDTLYIQISALSNSICLFIPKQLEGVAFVSKGIGNTDVSPRIMEKLTVSNDNTTCIQNNAPIPFSHCKCLNFTFLLPCLMAVLQWLLPGLKTKGAAPSRGLWQGKKSWFSQLCSQEFLLMKCCVCGTAFSCSAWVFLLVSKCFISSKVFAARSWSFGAILSYFYFLCLFRVSCSSARASLCVVCCLCAEFGTEMGWSRRPWALSLPDSLQTPENFSMQCGREDCAQTCTGIFWLRAHSDPKEGKSAPLGTTTEWDGDMQVTFIHRCAPTEVLF